MADQKLESGFTRIDNALLEKIIESDLTLREQKIVLAVIRYTNGFNREEAELSLRFLSEATKIDFRHVQRVVKTLIEKNVLIIKSCFKGSQSRVLQLNKNFMGSTDITGQLGDTNENIRVGQIGDSSVADSAMSPVGQKGDKEKKTLNKTLKKTIGSPQTPLFEDEKNSKPDTHNISWFAGSYKDDQSSFNNAASDNNQSNENNKFDLTAGNDDHTDINRKKKKQVKKDAVSLPAVPDALLQIQGFSDIWENWIIHRKEIKKPLTSMAAKLQFDKLLELRDKGSDVIELISTAIRNGWQGIWEVNNNNGGNYNGRNTENKGSLQSRLNYRFDPERYERERKEYIERYG